ncbi:thialysine N-epsilon-acetyltransferase-like [Lineus longissimus]|uniref:thialysine N-epsilon-acetyltransferase-like n=1 Tax=Lineus longissimus TaxID=88925 RepID=UPI002B4F82C5
MSDSSTENGFHIRVSVSEDCEAIVDLIKELAVYENMPEQVKIGADVLRRDGFGEDRYFHCYVAEVQDKGKTLTVGYCLYFFTYSTWEGRMIYLEDLYVKPEFRGRGIGNAFLSTVAKVGIDRDCCRIHFVCLDWNKSSIEFYKRKNGICLTEKEGWQMWRWDREAMKQIAQG